MLLIGAVVVVVEVVEVVVVVVEGHDTVANSFPM